MSKYKGFELVAKNGKLYWLDDDGISVETASGMEEINVYKFGGSLADEDTENTLLDLVFVWLTEGKEFKASYVDGKLDYEYIQTPEITITVEDRFDVNHHLRKLVGEKLNKGLPDFKFPKENPYWLNPPYNPWDITCEIDGRTDEVSNKDLIEQYRERLVKAHKPTPDRFVSRWDEGAGDLIPKRRLW